MRLAKCCALQLPRQFGEGEHVVFAGNMVPKTLASFLKRSTKCCAPVLRTASCRASMAGPIAVRSTQFGEREHIVFAAGIGPKTLVLFLK